MSALPAGTVTLMLTDIEGSTGAWSLDSDAMRAAMVAHDEILVSAVSSHGGHVVKHTGDGILAAFASAPAATATAIEAQRALDEVRWPEASGRLRVRVALHTADLEPTEDDDYRGPDVNLLARIEAVAHGGQILASQATASLLSDHPAIAAIDLGVHRLRGVGAPQRLFHLAEATSTAPVPLPRTGRQERAPLDSLIGRDADLEHLRDLVTSHRLVTVSGPGGVGKTSLARALLASLGSRWSAVWVDLTPLDASAVADGVADEFGYGSFDGMVSHLAMGEWLVVFDNCEHVLDQATAVIGTLLDRCPGLTVVATSREPTELAGERVIRLAPLSTEAPGSAAVQLFVDRAAARGVEIDPRSGQVLRLVRALDGLPLAIELAAARSSTLSPTDMLDRLKHGIDVLERRRFVGPERHRSLGATIEWSLSLLDDELSGAAERLSILSGPFSMEMAEAAIGSVSAGADVVMSELVERSLVIRLAGPRASFRMLDTVRAAALERLREHDEEAATRARVAARVADDLTRAGGEPVMGELGALYPFQEGFAWTRDLVESSLAGDDGSDRAFALVGGFWALEDYGRQAEGTTLLEAVLHRWPEPNESSGRVRGILSALHRIWGRTDRAHQLGQMAVASESAAGRAFGHRTLGQIARRLRDWETAADHFRAGTEAATAGGERLLAAEIEMHLALTMARSGDIDGAARLAEARLASDAAAPPISQLFLAWLLITPDPSRARELSEAVLDERGGTGDAWSVGTASYQLGVLDLLDGDEAAAARHLHRSIESFLEIRNRTDIALALYPTAALLSGAGLTALGRAARITADALTEPGLGDFEAELLGRLGLPGEPGGPARLHDPEAFLEPLAHLAGGAPNEPVQAESVNHFERRGELWRITYRGVASVVRHAKGMTDLATLLARPGIEVSALDLVGAEATQPGVEASDRQARLQYEERARDLAEEISEARDHNDPERLSNAQEELDAIAEHVASVYGMGGRARTGGDTAERARSAVTWRIRSAIGKIGEVDADLGDHLDRSVRTGRFCAYEPETETIWQM